MSIALDSGGNRIGGGAGGFIRSISSFPIYESPEVTGTPPDGQRFGTPAPAQRPESSSCSSSIGRNSDCSAAGSEEDAGEAEVQSTYKGPLDTMDALEESLPIRRGVSKFYCGKSKSFTSLVDAVSACTSAKDLTKPENPYNRKRKNLLAFSTMWDRTRPHDSSLRSTKGGISKRPAKSSRCTLNLVASTSSSGSNSSEEEHEPSRHLPPLHPRSKPPPPAVATPFSSSPHGKFSFPMRSFSLTDLQGVASSGSLLGPGDKHKRFQ